MKNNIYNERIDELLGYPRIKIIQRDDMFNFSLDSLLLANFVNIPIKKSIIYDFGTGTAPIPLYLSLKTSHKIYGVEIQNEVAEIARRNIKLNELEHQIEIIEADIKSLIGSLKPSSVDLITCNPPFFKVSKTSNLNESPYKSIARHEITINLEDIIKTASKLLKTHGHLVIVYRVERFIELIEHLKKYQFQIKRIRFVHPKKDFEANMVLVDATHNGASGCKILPPLIVHEGEDYSETVKKIFHYGRM